MSLEAVLYFPKTTSHFVGTTLTCIFGFRSKKAARDISESSITPTDANINDEAEGYKDKNGTEGNVNPEIIVKKVPTKVQENGNKEIDDRSALIKSIEGSTNNGAFILTCNVRIVGILKPNTKMISENSVYHLKTLSSGLSNSAGLIYKYIKLFSNTNEERILFINQPTTVICDTDSNIGVNRFYRYFYRLPDDMVPSYQGKAMVIHYQLQVEVQYISEKPKRKILSVPFTVLSNAKSLSNNITYEINPYIVKSDAGVIIDFKETHECKYTQFSNPDSDEDLPDMTELQRSSIPIDYHMDAPLILDYIPHSNQHNITNIVESSTNRSGGVFRMDPIATFSISRTLAFKNELLAGTLRFSRGSNCLKTTILLESTECISEENRAPGFDSKELHPIVSSIPVKVMNTQCIDEVRVVIMIPHSIQPSFTSNLVVFLWKLRFTFIVPSSDNSADNQILEPAPSNKSSKVYLTDLQHTLKDLLVHRSATTQNHLPKSAIKEELANGFKSFTTPSVTPVKTLEYLVPLTIVGNVDTFTMMSSVSSPLS